MIELKRVEDVRDPSTGELWSDETNEHVISQEGGRWFVRDEEGGSQGWDTFAQAFADAQDLWLDVVTLEPANRLRRVIAEGRADEVGHFLLEYLADYGAVGIDVQALAQQVFQRVGADEEAWR